MYTIFKFFTAVFLFLIILAAGYFLIKWFTAPPYRIGELERGEVLRFNEAGSAQGAEENSLRVLSYNIGFGAGSVQHTLADEHPESFYTANLDKFIDLVRKERANIVLLQEVDLDSKRSWYMNQLEYIMERLGWGYAAPVVDWDMFFPLRKERKITKATVVISKFPIVANEYTRTSCKPNFENMLLNVFYYPLLWESTMQRVGVEVGDKRLDVYNVHLCVWNREARVAQARYLTDWVNRESAGVGYLIGGDFNFQAYIRGTPLPEDDLAKPPFINEFRERLQGCGEILSSSGDSADVIHKNYTFDERKHRYDFLFYSSGLVRKEGEVVRSIDASDHFPVFGEFRLLR
ncbi:endonuclease/exonuclease/phosphatase family protein [Desulfovibrio sp. JC010]|uniref:endonuclease/exonuclease/phosphatase family protein n=1 Tax=Desulfovibrio sp. JC010 TaxID=2593641 RepID=UPI0013D1A6BD|nr:endonuclease/exonuclease/phosphatase family protein [Desulfovibrio sp. JC010]NDV27896.1 endonuclease/exonuclease/phosphatase [Desulfovibrio sp. JC010]